jgi:hypothetical protein
MLRSGSTSLTLGLVLSMAMHAGLGLALFLSPASGREEAPEHGSTVLLMPPEPPKVKPLSLGLDDDRASGEAWLGLMEPSPHSATEEGMFDQAELSPSASSAALRDTEEQAGKGDVGETVSRMISHTRENGEPGVRTDVSVPPVSIGPVFHPENVPGRVVAMSDVLPALVVKRDAEESPAVDLSSPEDGTRRAEVQTPERSESTALNEARDSGDGEVADGGAAVDERSGGGPAIADTRESDAVARQPIATAIPGRPLAANGLEITTVRPRWPISTRVTREPANPTVRLTFGRSGRVTHVEFVKSTGFEDVDEPLRTALYQWRAKGAALASLPAVVDASLSEPGIEVTVRVVLR